MSRAEDDCYIRREGHDDGYIRRDGWVAIESEDEYVESRD